MCQHIAHIIFGFLVIGIMHPSTVQATDLVFYIENDKPYYVDFDHPRYESILSMVPNGKFFSVYGTGQGLYVVYSREQDSSAKNDSVIVKYLEPPTLTAENNQPVLTKSIEQGDRIFVDTYRYKCLLLVWISRENNGKTKYAVLRGSRILDTVVLSRPSLDKAALRYTPSTLSDSIQLDRIISSDQYGIDGQHAGKDSCNPFEVAKLPGGDLGIYKDGVLQNKIKVDCISDIVLDKDDTIVQLIRDFSNVSNSKFVVRVEVFVINARNEIMNRSYFIMLLCDTSGAILRKLITQYQLRNSGGLAFISW